LDLWQLSGTAGSSRLRVRAEGTSAGGGALSARRAFAQRELTHLKNSGVQTLVSLLSLEQVEMLELEQEPAIAMQLGWSFFTTPSPTMIAAGRGAISRFRGRPGAAAA